MNSAILNLPFVVQLPNSITNDKNLNRKGARTQNYYAELTSKYQEINNRCEGLKATMSSVAILAASVFTCIMIGASSTVSLPLIVASILAVGAIGLTAAICSAVYYGFKADQNETLLKNLPYNFNQYYEAKLLENAWLDNPPSNAPPYQQV